MKKKDDIVKKAMDECEKKFGKNSKGIAVASLVIGAAEPERIKEYPADIKSLVTQISLSEKEWKHLMKRVNDMFKDGWINVDLTFFSDVYIEAHGKIERGKKYEQL
jgi:hypothetical protein